MLNEKLILSLRQWALWVAAVFMTIMLIRFVNYQFVALIPAGIAGMVILIRDARRRVTMRRDIKKLRAEMKELQL